MSSLQSSLLSDQIVGISEGIAAGKSRRFPAICSKDGSLLSRHRCFLSGLDAQIFQRTTPPDYLVDHGVHFLFSLWTGLERLEVLEVREQRQQHLRTDCRGASVRA